MYSVCKDFQFAAAHRIAGHRGKCRNLHGHNYRVRVHVAARQLDEIGMVIDFADLKAILSEILDPLDHRVINEIPPFDRMNTTAEELSAYVYREVAARLTAHGVGRDLTVRRVEVWENDSSCAVYEP